MGMEELDPLDGNGNGAGVFFHIPFADHAENYENVNIGAYEFNVDVNSGLVRPGVATALGIPTHLLLDCHLNSDLAACEHIMFTDADGIFNANTHNIYFPDIAHSNDGKDEHETGDRIRQLHEMTYWGLQGAIHAQLFPGLNACQNRISLPCYLFNTKLMLRACPVSFPFPDVKCK